MTNREKMALLDGLSFFATERAKVIFAITAAYNKGRADMREEAAVAVDTERMLRELHKSRALDAKRKQEARDFETMAIAHVQSAAAIRAIPVEDE